MYYLNYSYELAKDLGWRGLARVNSFLTPIETGSPIDIPLPLLDPRIKENALKILNLTEEEAKNQDRVDEAFQKLKLALNEKKEKVAPPYANALQKIIDNANEARETLIKPLSSIEAQILN